MFYVASVDVSHVCTLSEISSDSENNIDNDMVAMFDNAYKQQPTNEELGAQTFFANVRTGNWKVAQQVRHPQIIQKLFTQPMAVYPDFR